MLFSTFESCGKNFTFVSATPESTFEEPLPRTVFLAVRLAGKEIGQSLFPSVNHSRLLHALFLFFRRILRRGGKAADAAIATLLCEGVHRPQLMGVGGGLLATIYRRSDGHVKSIIATGSAPGLATKNMFANLHNNDYVTGECVTHFTIYRKWYRFLRNNVYFVNRTFGDGCAWRNKGLLDSVQEVRR